MWHNTTRAQCKQHPHSHWALGRWSPNLWQCVCSTINPRCARFSHLQRFVYLPIQIRRANAEHFSKSEIDTQEIDATRNSVQSTIKNNVGTTHIHDGWCASHKHLQSTRVCVDKSVDWARQKCLICAERPKEDAACKIQIRLIEAKPRARARVHNYYNIARFVPRSAACARSFFRFRCRQIGLN